MAACCCRCRRCCRAGKALLPPARPPQGRWGYRRVLSSFGPSILHADGSINREALAALAFADAAQRRRLNAAVHPAVATALACSIAGRWLACAPVLVVDMPLLFESGFAALCSPRVVVACSPTAQLARLTRRDGLDAGAAAARVAAQMPLERKRRLADVVLENEGGVEELAAQVHALAARLQRRAWLHRLLLSPLGLLASAAAAWALWARQAQAG